MKDNRFTLAATFVLLAVVGGFALPANGQVKGALVQDQDEPGRHPYSVKFFNTTGNTPGTFASLPMVPLGKRLVLQFISFHSSTSAVGYITISINGLVREIFVPLVATVPNVGIASAQIAGYVDGGQHTEVYLISGAVSNGTGTLSGYMIDCTATAPCAAPTP